MRTEPCPVCTVMYHANIALVFIQDEYENIQFNWFYGTIKELSEAFTKENSQVRRAGLQLLSTQEVLFPCQFAEMWKKIKHGRFM